MKNEKKFVCSTDGIIQTLTFLQADIKESPWKDAVGMEISKPVRIAQKKLSLSTESAWKKLCDSNDYFDLDKVDYSSQLEFLQKFAFREDEK